ncbi:MAG TPA: hypothetical protein EYN73_01090 [Chromatiaceae bacterium]|nr:hypothetical protein [Chromatiaceae bacterium]HIA07683.1 hypothetical protein [Chromatiaceae bacterium]HIN83098.1 hypothetical protein [Chromatiales bacterium]HIO54620.1 hypothetical protein [Chromatiales bacterium]
MQIQCRSRFLVSVTVGCLLGLAVGFSPAQASHGYPLMVSSESFDRSQQRRPLSLDKAVSRIRKKINGRVLSATTRSREGRKIHHIRILDSKGRVRQFEVDANSGERIVKPARLTH